MPTRTRLPLAAVGLLLAVAVAACGGSSSATGAPATQAPTAVAATDAPASAAAGTAGKVSANNASTGELVAALEAAGVPNASRWVREVEEYRPYPADDPTLQKLQDNLAKYNPDAATLAGILAALEP